MAYEYTVDEWLPDGVTPFHAGVFDAPSYLNTSFVLADAEFGFGALVGYERDVYALGVLAPGVYRVVATDLTWDPTRNDGENLSYFRLLNSSGETLEVSYVAGDYIEFTVTEATSYSVEIVGGSYGSMAQYAVGYAWIMPLDVVSDVSVALADPQRHLYLVGTSDIDGIGNEHDNDILGNAGSNLLDGLGGDDVIFGYAGVDGLLGGSGDDILDGGTGADVMAGEAGNDLYGVDQADDVVLEEAGAGLDGVLASVTYVLPAWVEGLRLSETAGDIGGGGNDLANLIEGNDGINVLMGFGGNDTLRGGGGSDWLDGGTGSDDMEGGAGDDTYVLDAIGDDILGEASAGGYDHVFSAVFYFFQAGVEELTLIGDGDSNGWGNNFANVMTGNRGENILDGKGGEDSLAGGGGDDLIWGGAGNDVLAGGGAADSLYAGGANDVLSGGGGGDRLVGNGGDDVLTGGAGSDNLSGDGGDDALVGGKGEDYLSGGGGRDVFVFTSAADAGRGLTCDSVVFDRGRDRIDLNAIDANEAKSGNQAFRYIGERDFDGAGQLRCENGWVQADTDGDGRADFEINIAYFYGTLKAGDFVL
jgi:Ca2+-binding RTX toxin-like protein